MNRCLALQRLKMEAAAARYGRDHPKVLAQSRRVDELVNQIMRRTTENANHS